MKRTQSANTRNREQDATKIYLKEVSLNPLLSHAEEIELSQQIEAGRKQMIQGLFEIPHTVNHMTEQLKLMRSGERNQQQAFVVESTQELTDLIDKTLELTQQLSADPQNAELVQLVSTQLSELPISLAFWDELMAPWDVMSQNLMKAQGELLRHALATGMTRECFLQNYQHDTPDETWCAWATKHDEHVNKYRAQVQTMADNSGVSIQKLQHIVKQIRSARRDKDLAVNRMLKSNLRLVVSVAKRYTQVTSTPLLDLIQEGNLGLMRAIEKFNWRLGFRFSTYATWWIKQCVLKAVNEQHRIIRIPSHMTDLAKKVIQAREEYVSTVGYEPSVSEIAQMLEQDETQVARVYTVAQGTISLETPVGQEEDQNLGNLIEDTQNVNPFDMVSAVDTQRAVSAILSELTPKEERVIRMRFGIGVDQEATLEDVGNVMGVTRERIRQIEQRALQKLKEPLMAQKVQQAFE